MQAVLVLLGTFLILLLMVDAIWTTLALKGGGPLSRWVLYGVTKILLHRDHPHLRASVGPAVLLSTYTLWWLLLWAGWLLIFLSSDSAVLQSQSSTPADFWARVYFVGYTLSTLGLGDYKPSGAFYQTMTAVASANGFFLISLSVAYTLSVLSAVVDKRRLAFHCLSLGHTPEKIVRNGWSGEDFNQLEKQFSALTPDLIQLGQRHLAYPILNGFYTVERETDTSVAVAVMDETLNLLEAGVASSVRPSPTSILPAREAIGKFLAVTQDKRGSEKRTAPDAPPLTSLQEAGIPTVSQPEFAQALRGQDHRRRRLLALVRSSGWSWETVHGASAPAKATV